MAGYILREDQPNIVLPAQQADRLIGRGDGDAALLYLYLMRAEDAVTAEQLMEKLSMSALRLQGAQTKLEKMGLIQAQGLPLPEPEQRPAEYTATDLMQLLRDPEFEMLVGETERSLGKKLTTVDLKRLANLRHEVGLPADVIIPYAAKRPVAHPLIGAKTQGAVKLVDGTVVGADRPVVTVAGGRH